jgi:hypothetical protein
MAARNPFKVYIDFTSRSAGDAWVIGCKHCSMAWTWPKAKPVPVGVRLRLLNHGRSHLETKGGG